MGPLLAVRGRLGPKNVEEYDYLKNVLISRAGARSAASGRSWASLGPSVGGLGRLLGPMLPVLGRSWAYVAGLGPLLGLMLKVLEPLLGPLLAVLRCLGPKSGQGPGGEAIWPAIRAEKSPEQLHIRGPAPGAFRRNLSFDFCD